ncbi:hypothetical protein RFI_00080 [Reticulomyxa filosa]|uniref:Peptidase A1 domain-containing protein n=1 Tax=Reticulomyxa filosa TaxID=46433 RepID=X6PFJ4_RETFI|nr:hypothetical protein RFI_00080 [Reticulomyxa filosa]|eukprot:ETO36981.1 hypothetical protein RFI_00080 [Reticulomyxa filosa]
MIPSSETFLFILSQKLKHIKHGCPLYVYMYTHMYIFFPNNASDIENNKERILQDWNVGKIAYYVTPTAIIETNTQVQFVQQFGKAFDIDAIFNESNSKASKCSNKIRSNRTKVLWYAFFFCNSLEIKKFKTVYHTCITVKETSIREKTKEVGERQVLEMEKKHQHNCINKILKAIIDSGTSFITGPPSDLSRIPSAMGARSDSYGDYFFKNSYILNFQDICYLAMTAENINDSNGIDFNSTNNDKNKHQAIDSKFHCIQRKLKQKKTKGKHKMSVGVCAGGYMKWKYEVLWCDINILRFVVVIVLNMDALYLESSESISSLQYDGFLIGYNVLCDFISFIFYLCLIYYKKNIIK